jgi:hypothetical protein
MALMHAEYSKWEGYREKIPSGRIWASPSKPEGYLRKSILRGLARRIHDEDTLPEELIEAGSFEDTNPPTWTDTADHMAELEIGIKMRHECQAKAGKPNGDSEDEEESEEW